MAHHSDLHDYHYSEPVTCPCKNRKLFRFGNLKFGQPEEHRLKLINQIIETEGFIDSTKVWDLNVLPQIWRTVLQRRYQ